MIDVRWQLLAYVLASIVLRVVAAQLIRGQGASSWASRLNRGLPASVLRFVYFIGFPYVALVLGVIPARYLGLVGGGRLPHDVDAAGSSGGISAVRGALPGLVLNWMPDLWNMLGVAAILCLVLGASWWGYGRFKRLAVEGTGNVTAHLANDGPVATGVSLVTITYQEVHWAFYRGAVWLLFSDLYLAVVAGIALVAIEWVLSPGNMQKMRQASTAEQPLVDASLLLTSSAVFFFVPNLWLLIPLHWLLVLLIRWAVRLGSGSRRVQFVQS